MPQIQSYWTWTPLNHNSNENVLNKIIPMFQVMCFVFVFAALLEYAAVNYTYWGARAKKKKKEKKQREKV